MEYTVSFKDSHLNLVLLHLSGVIEYIIRYNVQNQHSNNLCDLQPDTQEIQKCVVRQHYVQ